MHRVSGRTLRTLYFVNSGEVASDEMLYFRSDIVHSIIRICTQNLSSEASLQKHHFRSFTSEAPLDKHSSEASLEKLHFSY